MKTAKAIRVRIRALMSERNMTEYSLIKATGMAPSTLKSIMTGKVKNPGVCTITIICTGFELTVMEFYNSELFNDWSMAEDDEGKCKE